MQVLIVLRTKQTPDQIYIASLLATRGYKAINFVYQNTRRVIFMIHALNNPLLKTHLQKDP